MNAVLWAISGAQVAAHRFVRLYPDLALKLYEQVGWGFAAMAQQIDGPIVGLCFGHLSFRFRPSRR